MDEYKPKGCPLLLQSDTEPSMTVQGRSYTRSYFLPCLGHKCAAYKRDGARHTCERFGTSVLYRVPDESKKGDTDHDQ